MTSSLKDVRAADMVRNLAEMNYYKKDCTVYGYAYLNDEGKKIYRLSDNEVMLHRAFEADVIAMRSMTPVKIYTSRELLQEETSEEIYFMQKLKMANEIRLNFNDTYYNCLKEVQEVPSDEQALDIIMEWQEDIDGYFDEDAVRLFEGAVELAYATKHLPHWRYVQLLQWVTQVKKQMKNIVQMHDVYERTFYGLAYRKKDQEKYSYMYNANDTALFNQIKELDEQGTWHTPVYHKKYWYTNSMDLSGVRKQFVEDLKETMDQDYLDRMIRIQNLPSAIPEDLWKKTVETVKAECSADAVDALNYWANRWNLAVSE